MEKISIDWQKRMTFDSHIDGFTIPLDASMELGGSDYGPRPKALMLVALAGCTGMDVASLAQKMRVEIRNLNIEVEAEKSVEIPVVYTQIRLVYRFDARSEDTPKIIKMVTLSQQRYCGVAAMMRQVAQLSYEVFVNGEPVEMTVEGI